MMPYAATIPSGVLSAVRIAAPHQSGGFFDTRRALKFVERPVFEPQTAFSSGSMTAYVAYRPTGTSVSLPKCGQFLLRRFDNALIG
jgi:hypothetical protein